MGPSENTLEVSDLHYIPIGCVLDEDCSQCLVQMLPILGGAMVRVGIGYKGLQVPDRGLEKLLCSLLCGFDIADPG